MTVTHLVNKYVTCTHNAQIRYRSVCDMHATYRKIMTVSESLKPRKVFIFQHFSFEILYSVEMSMKSFIISGPGSAFF